MKKEIQKRYSRHRMIMSAQINLTWRCPLRCAHCFLDQRNSPELPTAFWEGVIQDLAQLGALQLTLSGGEVLVRKDLAQLIKTAKSLGFLVCIKTSGFLAGAEEWETLISSGLGLVHISFYHSDPELHDAITGTKGSFLRALDGILYLQSKGITAVAVFTLMEGGAQDPQALVDGLKALGIKHVAMNFLCQVGKEGKIVDNLALSQENLKRQFAYLSPAEIKPPPSMDSNLCHAGLTSISINPDGTVKPCSKIDMTLGDLKTQSLQEIWQNNPMLLELASLTWAKLKHCHQCKYIASCAYCPGEAWRDHGVFTRPSSETCQRAKIVWEETVKKQAMKESPSDS